MKRETKYDIVRRYAKIFNSQEVPEIRIQVRHWGFFQVPFWDNANVRKPCWILYWHPDEINTLEVDEKKFTPRRDTVYLFPPGTCYSGYSGKPFIQFYVHFNVNAPFDRVRNKMLKIPAKEIIPLILQTVRQKEKTMQSAMLHSVISRVLSEIPEDAFVKDERVIMDPRIRRIVTMIDENPGMAYSVQELSRREKMSLNNFYRKFTAEIGEPPQTYLLRQRLEYARSLLVNTESPVEEIALKSGFKNRYQFSKAFKQTMLFPPVKYRKRMERSRFMSDTPESQMNQFQKKPVISGEVSPADFFMKEKLKFARKLLQKSSLDLGEISLATGFRDSRQLSGIFKKEFGKTPSAFRSQWKRKKTKVSHNFLKH